MQYIRCNTFQVLLERLPMKPKRWKTVSSWEIPTGGVHSAEKLEEAARRELAEEAGYYAGRLIHISSYYTSKCICDETAHLYIGEDLTPAEVPPDDTEFLERRVFPFDEALRMTLEGEIMDSMSVVALLLAARRRAAS